MSVESTAVFLLLLGFLWSPLRADVTCVYLGSCLLPCPFDPGPDEVVHWLDSREESSPVHSFYHGTDQLALQNPRYRDRTALFRDQLSKGNASLLLSRVQISDRGRYKCYTSTIRGNKELFINVQVQAPVSEVFLEQVGDEVICRSEEIYPEPGVTWSGSDGTEEKPSVFKTEKGLYSISSSVRLSHKRPLEHSCNISTDHSWRSATLKQEDPVTASDSEVTLLCSDPNAPIKSLLWTFNQTQTILTKTGNNRDYNKTWRQFVEEVSESGLTLKSLSSDHQGVYSCVLSSDRETYISSTVLRVTEGIKTGSYTVLIAVVVSVSVTALLVLTGFFLWRREKQRQKTTASEETGKHEAVPLNGHRDRTTTDIKD